MSLSDRSVRNRRIILALACASALSACSRSGPGVSEATEEGRQALLEVGEMYRLFVASYKKAPKSVADFRGAQPAAPAGYRAVKDGSIIVIWSTMLQDTSEEGSTDSAEEILAYEKSVPEHGGQVLLKNRSVRTMTAAAFKSAPKAGG